MKEWNKNLMEEIEIDTDALIAAIENISEHAIFVDSYGDGVANINNTSYATYHELASDFNLDASDYQMKK